ncbi:MAG TPA: hypothetical protein VK497_01395 [Candidatus Saccharimonadales bacterium]|nr:hypothetical protein [Candidatus Saccharimonadales bacterium]
MGINAFTVEGGIIKAGVDVESFTLESGEVVRGILVGRADKPGFLPVVDNRLRNQEGDTRAHIKAVALDLEAPRLVVCSNKQEIDESQALVVFRAGSFEDEEGREEEITYYRGDTESGSDMWRPLSYGEVVPIRPSAEVVEVGTAQFIQVLRKGDLFTAWASSFKGLDAELYRWDGTDLLRLTKNTMRL